MTWLRRNAGPIAWVLVAAAVIIFAGELIDTLTAGDANDSTEETEAGETGITGLVKVAVFLAIPFALTLLVRRRAARSQPGTA